MAGPSANARKRLPAASGAAIARMCRSATSRTSATPKNWRRTTGIVPSSIALVSCNDERACVVNVGPRINVGFALLNCVCAANGGYAHGLTPLRLPGVQSFGVTRFGVRVGESRRCDAPDGYQMTWPPSTRRSTPVTNDAALLSRKMTGPTMSSGWAFLPRGVSLAYPSIASRCSGRCVIGV